MENSESPEEAIIREMREELGIGIEERSLVPLTFASHAYAEFHLLMTLFVCREWIGLPSPTEGQEVAWVRIRELVRQDSHFPMPPADAPLLPALKDHLG